MVNLHQLPFSLSLLLPSFFQPSHDPPTLTRTPDKSVAIIGAGSAGLAALKTFLDLPDDVRGNWDVTLFEQRRDVGGIWLPDFRNVSPPELPETPLYPRLRTNTPVPTMTYPGFPFPPNTPLYPSHEHIQKYHRDYATHYNLLPVIRFNHTVLTSNWVGNATVGHWNVTIRDHAEQLQQRTFDHLVVATGHNHYPNIPTWPGQQEWLENSPRNGPRREILHSIWYRNPEKYTNRSVIVMGSGASGRDAGAQIREYARKLYISVRHPNQPLPDNGTLPEGIIKPGISHFTPQGVVFTDGTTADDVDSLVLGTGYQVREPFLEHGDALDIVPSARSNETYTKGLVSNLRYFFPVYKHVLSLSPHYPTNALSFIGLPIYVANCPSDTAQSIFVVHSIANSSILPSREKLLQQLSADEDHLRSLGFDPYQTGHKLLPITNGTQWDYQDELVAHVKRLGALPNDGKPYVDKWRRHSRVYLRRGWKRVEELGQQEQWLRGVETEADWADLMERLDRWQGEWERSQGLRFPYEHPYNFGGF